MSARDDYPILVDWLAGKPMTGMNGDVMEVAVAAALNEIDRLRAEVEREDVTDEQLRAAAEQVYADQRQRYVGRDGDPYT